MNHKEKIDMSCIFCEIANGSIPSSTIYEDDQVRAILDINPASVGHVLIIPKKHCTSLLDPAADEATVHAVFDTAAKLARRLDEVLKPDGINLVSNMKEGAGQTVEHLHVHLIPRYTNHPEKDALVMTNGAIEKPDFDELVALLKED